MPPSSAPTNPDPIPASADPTRRNWLALASFLLSFSPLVVWMLTVRVSSMPFPPTPVSAYDSPQLQAMVLGTAVSLLGSMSAILTSRRAIGRAEWQWFADTGRRFGLLGIIVDGVFVACALVSGMLQGYHGG